MGRDTILISPDPDLADEAVWYQGKLERYVAEIEDSLKQGDAESLRIIGHRIKGSAESFGFEGAGKIGEMLESAAKAADFTALKTAAAALADYVSRIEIEAG